MEESETEKEPGVWAAIRRHPVIAAVLIVCTVGGAIGGLFIPFEGWSATRGMAAGALTGAWTGLLITGTRMLGAWS